MITSKAVFISKILGLVHLSKEPVSSHDVAKQLRTNRQYTKTAVRCARKAGLMRAPKFIKVLGKTPLRLTARGAKRGAAFASAIMASGKKVRK